MFPLCFSRIFICFSDIAEVLQKEHEALKDLAAKVYSKHSQLVELSQRLNTKAVPNDQVFFREHSKKASELPASAVVRPALGGKMLRVCSSVGSSHIFIFEMRFLVIAYFINVNIVCSCESTTTYLSSFYPWC